MRLLTARGAGSWFDRLRSAIRLGSRTQAAVSGAGEARGRPYLYDPAMPPRLASIWRFSRNRMDPGADRMTPAMGMKSARGRVGD